MVSGRAVIEYDLPPGLLGCMDRERRIIWLTRGLNEAQRRSVLAYEVAEFELGPFDPDRSDEATGEWAARLLIPFDALLRAFRTTDVRSEAAELLGVDAPTLRARLRGPDVGGGATAAAVAPLQRTKCTRPRGEGSRRGRGALPQRLAPVPLGCQRS